MDQLQPTYKDAIAPAIQQSWFQLDNLLTRHYLQTINQAYVAARQDGLDDVLKGLRADKITRILYDRAEDNLTKFNSIFAALYSAGSTVFVLLHSDGTTTEIFLGVMSDTIEFADTSIKTLEKSLQGNFPGITIVPQQGEDAKNLSDYIRTGKYVSCVSGVPSLKSDTPGTFFQGLEKIIDAMGDSPYTALFLATPVSRETLNSVERSYQDLYSCLSLLNISQLSLSEQESNSFGRNISKTLTQAISTSIAQANTYTESKSSSSSLTNTTANGVTDTRSHTTTDTLTKSSADTVSRAETQTNSHAHSESTTITKSTNATVGSTFGTFAGGGASGGFMGFGINVFGGISKSINKSLSVGLSHATTSGITDTVSTGTTNTRGHTDTFGTSTAEGNTIGRSDTHTESIGVGQTDTNGISQARTGTETVSLTGSDALTEGEQSSIESSNSKTYNYAVEDKHVTESLKRIDEQLARIHTAKNYGAWNWAGYFIADETTTVRNGADIYTGILSGEQTGTERTSVAVWDDDKDKNLNNLKQWLCRFEHPVFQIGDYNFNATSLVSTPEVAVAMSLPQKSLPRIPVYEATAFGRAVVSFDVPHTDPRICTIGKVSHLDHTTEEIVKLHFDSLSSHMFITGSTGSGKSNAVNRILASLRTPEYENPQAKTEERIKFLVIEPAKGEYKDIWNAIRGCNIFGTNPNYSPLLKINPFSFPDGIHVMEHVDRLIEILNAVWPMYAAMPAILKDAVEKTYIECGWDLVNNRNIFQHKLFPDFFDLLRVLPRVIKSSEYSDETKGNYAGALITRLKSLTNGYYRLIFQKEEHSAKTLFDKNTIIDLSRVGSVETKSLLMGILFLKLQEYRMSKKCPPNQNLRHVTVLEEAHHLLRKTSLEQNSETANLQGKSVEMLTNAIAEMRTYGEGFIIADQAPGLLDPAVIRNTNTKIVFRLPDYDDRVLVGKSQHLSEEQIMELSRLRTGCAAVYQNNWQEAVLCQFDRFDKEELIGQLVEPTTTMEYVPKKECDSRTEAETLFLQSLLVSYKAAIRKELGLSQDENASDALPALSDRAKEILPAYFPCYVADYGKHSIQHILWWINATFVVDNVAKMPTKTLSRNVWIDSLEQGILKTDSRIKQLTDPEFDLFRCAMYRIFSEYSDTAPEEKTYWHQYSQLIQKEIFS